MNMFFSFELLQLMICESIFSMDFNRSLKIISDPLAFTGKLDNKLYQLNLQRIDIFSYIIVKFVGIKPM